VDRFEPIRVGGEGFADRVVVLRCGGDRGELRRAPWLKASASIASSGQIQSSGLIDIGLATIAAM
jgi:hypothetical protein